MIWIRSASLWSCHIERVDGGSSPQNGGPAGSETKTLHGQLPQSHHSKNHVVGPQENYSEVQ